MSVKTLLKYIHTYTRYVEVCRAFALTVSAKKTETMCMPPPRTPRTAVRIEAAGQIYKQVQSFPYLGGAVTETPDMSVEIARRTRACWMRIKRYTGALRPTESRALSQDPDGEGRSNRSPSVWMQYVDPPPGTLRPTSYRTPPGLASHHRGAAQETRPPCSSERLNDLITVSSTWELTPVGTRYS